MPELQIENSDHWVHDSAAVGGRFHVTLTTPLVGSDQPVPLLVLLDGHTMLLTATEVSRTISLVTMRALPQIALVAIHRDSADYLEYFSTRFQDFTPHEWVLPEPFDLDNAMMRHGSGRAHAFLDAIVDEILPDVRRRVAVDDSQVGICGWSLSGLFATYAWRERPDVFAHLAAISPSLWWNHAAILDEPLPPRPAEHRVLVTAGEHEEGDVALVWPQQFAHAAQREMAAMVTNAVRFGELAAACGATTKTAVLADEHHVSLVPASIAKALLHFYG